MKYLPSSRWSVYVYTNKEEYNYVDSLFMGICRNFSRISSNQISDLLRLEKLGVGVGVVLRERGEGTVH